MMSLTISPSEIKRVHGIIAPYIRRTPTIEVVANDFGIAGDRLSIKLELLQLYECVVERKQPLTNASAFLTDLKVLIQIAQAFG